MIVTCGNDRHRSIVSNTTKADSMHDHIRLLSGTLGQSLQQLRRKLTPSGPGPKHWEQTLQLACWPSALHCQAPPASNSSARKSAPTKHGKLHQGFCHTSTLWQKLCMTRLLLLWCQLWKGAFSAVNRASPLKCSFHMLCTSLLPLPAQHLGLHIQTQTAAAPVHWKPRLILVMGQGTDVPWPLWVMSAAGSAAGVMPV